MLLRSFRTSSELRKPNRNWANATITIASNDSQASNMGGVIGFGGVYDGLAHYANWGSIKSLKTNSTSGDYSGYMSFYTRNNGSASAERMRIDNTGNVTIGSTTLTSLFNVGSSAQFQS